MIYAFVLNIIKDIIPLSAPHFTQLSIQTSGAPMSLLLKKLWLHLLWLEGITPLISNWFFQIHFHLVFYLLCIILLLHLLNIHKFKQIIIGHCFPYYNDFVIEYLLCAKHCAIFFMCIPSLNPHISLYSRHSIPLLQTGQVEFKHVKFLAQGHIAKM